MRQHERRLRDSEKRLATELEAVKTLQRISTELVSEHQPDALYTQLLDAAMAVMKSDAASVQILDSDKARLKLLASRNFHPDSEAFWQWVDVGSASSCGQALETNARVLVEDVDASAAMAGTADLAAYARSGLRSVQSTPLIARDGRRLGMLSTHWRKRHRPEPGDFSLFDVLARQAADLIDRNQTETALRVNERFCRALVEGVPQLVWRADRQGQWTWASPQWTTFTGQAEADSHGLGWLDPVHPDDRADLKAVWASAASRGEFHADYRVRHALEQRYSWFQARATAVRDDRGRIVEWLGTSTDVDDIRQMQERQKVLVGELQHRTRNLMCVVRSIADRTGEASLDLADFRVRFCDRLEALARVQGLLSRLEDTDRIAFDELITTELAAMKGAGEQTVLDGPPGIRLRSSTVQILAMALHELATNAVKYGALGQLQARLAITWSMERPDAGGQPWLHIDWCESNVRMPEGGPGSQRSGQGRELIEQALPYQLGAKTSFDLELDGVHCKMSIPVSASNRRQEIGHG